MSPAAQQRSALEACRRILSRGDLEAKLAPLGSDMGLAPQGATAGLPERPARAAGLEMAGGAAPLPRPGALGSREARGTCLARFAHHELQAVELFAWALLRWPRVPRPLALGWLAILADEQRHARGYLQRLESLGFAFADFAPHSDYFWRNAGVIDGPEAFLAAMGLTLEQANLDFTLVYRDAFREAGDEESAALCQQVHDDEVAHVAFASRWLERLDPQAGPVERYEAAAPFPFSAARAKGRRFDVGARRRAGLPDPLIEHVRRARSSQEQA